MSETEPPHPLRWWWTAPALAILLMAGAWGYHERPRLDFGDTTLDTRFLDAPRAQLDEDAAPAGGDERLAIDWKSAHDGIIRYREVDVLVSGAAPTFVTRDPDVGEWAAQRGTSWMGPGGLVREDDIIVIGSEGGLSGADVRVVVDPCDCTAATTVLG